jgi:hypothetical protein
VTISPLTKRPKRPGSTTRPRRGRPNAQPGRRGLVAVLLGATLVLGLILGVAPHPPEADDGQRLQAIWSDPIPSFLTSALTSQAAAPAGRSVLPTDPPHALGVPVVASRGVVAPTTGGGIRIRVFFSRRPHSDAAFSAVFPVARVAPDRAVATAALAGLIEGPTAAERAVGYFSELGDALTGPSSCDGRDFRITLASGTATVRFCRTVTSGGVGQDARMQAQIEATLGQFSTIRAIRLIGRSGHCLFDASGQDRCLAAAAPVEPPPGRPTGAR